MPFVRDRWPQKGNCFVIMPYGVQELRDGQTFDWDEHYRDVIEETVRQAGMTPLRADVLYGPPTLLERLWQGIQEAEVIIADLTGRNPNVLYEFGLAHVIGKRILILTMFPDDVPVDLGQFVQIPYKKEGRGILQLARDLQRNLEAARKEPPAEAMLMPLRGAGIEEISARVLSVMPDFAMIEARDGRKGFLSVEDFAWTRTPRDLTRVLQIGKDLKGAFVVDSNGQQKYSLTFGDNPWPKLEKEFPINEVFRSVVVNVREGTGAWVNMNYGIHGFIPQGQLTREVVAGIEVRARVVEINQAKREVRLQFIEIPRDQVKGDSAWPFRRGQVFEGRVDRTAPDRGFALIKINHEDRPVTGILPQAKMTPMLRDRFFNQDLRAGDPLMVEVVDVDPARQRLSFRDRPSTDITIAEPQAEMLQAY
jgi:small subunit ribosomal protein S1